jgi:hypothetical protein
MLSNEAAALGGRASALLAENVTKLRTVTCTDSVEQCLIDWAVVLGTLAKDVLDSTLLLLNAGQLRGANMLSRALVDYDVRLRFYVVQCKHVRAKLKKRPHIDPSERVEAVLDWNNHNYKMGSVLSLYDPSVWPQETRDALDRLMETEETERTLDLTRMICFLEEHEAKVLGLILHYIDESKQRKRSVKPNWRLQSGFLHGDQMIVSDVIEFDEDGQKTGRLIETPPVRPNTILFTAIIHVQQLLSTFELLHGNASGAAALDDQCGRVWRSERKRLSAD